VPVEVELPEAPPVDAPDRLPVVDDWPPHEAITAVATVIARPTVARRHVPQSLMHLV
jgi:hypothetical protein